MPNTEEEVISESVSDDSVSVCPFCENEDCYGDCSDDDDCQECSCFHPHECDVDTECLESETNTESSELGATTCDDSESEDDKCILRGKWMYDGSRSIDDMIAALEREVALLRDLQNDGWVVEGVIENDYACLRKNNVSSQDYLDTLD